MTGTNNDEPAKSVYQFSELESSREKSGKSYLPFLNVSSMHCGIYTLAAGAKDSQQPHDEDEVYYVEAGEAKININGKDHNVRKGSIVFVPAKAPHHFHSIKSDLKTLVFFSKGPVDAKDKKAKLDMTKAINEVCPRSGKPIAADSLVTYREHVVGFCNPHCRDDFAANVPERPDDRAFFDKLIDKK